MPGAIDIGVARREVQKLVCLTDIAVRYMLDPDFGSETREQTLSYLAELLVEQVISVESALDAAPADAAS